MPTLQTAFNQFHDAIKLSDVDENATLREKRDILLNKLEDKISDDAASYTYFNQGSYAMHTGISPDDGDYDIDVGLRFDIDKDDYPDPVAVKKWVYDALEGHTKSVEIRKPCVTVKYQRDGEEIYHVDFAVYAASNKDGKLYLARGKEFAASENKFWEESDPMEFMRLIRERFKDSGDAAQFRRIIRYLKKWKSRKFSSQGNAAPTGISLTMLAYQHFSPSSTIDVFHNRARVDNDFDGLKRLVQAIKQDFSCTFNPDGSIDYDIHVYMPTPPYNDLFGKMTQKQKTAFHDGISNLLEVLEKVETETALSEKCKLLQDVFGTDFPILSDRSVVGTSESA